MPLVLYSCLASPPVRASNLLLETLKIPYDKREVNIVKGDQFDEDFQKVSLINSYESNAGLISL